MPGIRTLVLCVLVTGAGCTSLPWQRSGEAPPPMFLEEEEELAVEPMTEFYVDPVVEPLPEPVSRLGIAPYRRFSDMPLPAGAKEDQERTYVYESSRLQIGRMIYTAKGTLNELTQFFIEEYKVEGWTLKSVLRAEGADLLFGKPGKGLRVTIAPSTRTTRGRQVTLNLVPAEGPGL